MSEKEGKTRRRFLADLLFLGGGLTAAAILAENFRTPTATDPTPTFAATPTPEGTPEAPPQPEGKVAIPDGDYVQAPPAEPTPPPVVKGEMKPPQAAQTPHACPEPAIEGRKVAPRPGQE